MSARWTRRPGGAERVCLLLITAAAPEAPTVQSVTHIDPGAVHEAKYFIKKMRTLGMWEEYLESDSIKRMCEWEKTPDSAKKCRSLEAHPLGRACERRHATSVDSAVQPVCLLASAFHVSPRPRDGKMMVGKGLRLYIA